MENEISIEVLVLKRLRELSLSRGRIISFPDVFARIYLIFCITKEDTWAVLKSMEEKGLIEIVPYHMVRIRGKAVQQIQGIF